MTKLTTLLESLTNQLQSKKSLLLPLLFGEGRGGALIGVFVGLFSLSAYAQYPTIPDSVKARGAQESAQWDELNEQAWQRALPTVMQGMFDGKPFVPQCSKPSDLKQASIPAFPGAEGGGKYSFGGRGVNYLGVPVESKVFVVTSLADSGPGTLREACEAGGPRVVVFNVAGEIKLKRPINIIAPYITIAGQTAPGDGIVLTGETMEVDTHDVIIRFMRFRRGATDVAHRDDACGGNGIGNIIYDHCSASWGLDEVMSMYRHVYARLGGKQDKLPTVNITIQDCIFAHGMDLYNHAFGASIGGYNSLFTRNLFANNISRNPSIAMNGDFNFVNNVIFNWWNRSIDGGDNLSEYNIINNYFKPGPITGFSVAPKGKEKGWTDKALALYLKQLKKGDLMPYYLSEYCGKGKAPQICYRVLKPEHGRSKDKQELWGKAYVGGNYVEGFADVTADNWNGGVQPALAEDNDNTLTAEEKANKYKNTVRQLLKQDKPFSIPEFNGPIMTTQQTYDYVLANVGATLPKRDAVDNIIIEEVTTGKPYTVKDAQPCESPYSHRRLPADSYKLGIITVPQQMGGLPEYNGTPRTDSDHDGMPDEWEKAHGLNPYDASDATKLTESGYMNVELYINDLDYFKK